MFSSRLFPINKRNTNRSMVKLKELETWLTTGEAAAMLGRTKQGTINLIKSGRVRGVKTRAGWLYDPTGVEEFRQRKRADTSQGT